MGNSHESRHCGQQHLLCHLRWQPPKFDPRRTWWPHVLPEDDDPVEENPVEDTSYAPDTEAAFLALLDAINSSTTDSQQCSECHCFLPGRALTRFTVTLYPISPQTWVSIVLDLKEVLPNNGPERLIGSVTNSLDFQQRRCLHENYLPVYLHISRVGACLLH